MSNLNKYDFVIYGATGFTGKLVVEYAINQYESNNEISWAIAGRNNEKLEHVQENTSKQSFFMRELLLLALMPGMLDGLPRRIVERKRQTRRAQRAAF